MDTTGITDQGNKEQRREQLLAKFGLDKLSKEKLAALAELETHKGFSVLLEVLTHAKNSRRKDLESLPVSPMALYDIVKIQEDLWIMNFITKVSSYAQTLLRINHKVDIKRKPIIK